MTEAQVIEIVGRPPLPVQADGGPHVDRWIIVEGEDRYLVYVRFVAGKVASRGSDKIEVFR
jgi:hypothetical protein